MEQIKFSPTIQNLNWERSIIKVTLVWGHTYKFRERKYLIKMWSGTRQTDKKWQMVGVLKIW